MLKALAKNLNFRFVVSEPPDGSYGFEDRPGHWNGMLGMLQRGEADVIAAALTATYKRSEIVDFTTAYHFESLGILIAEPPAPSKLWQVYMPIPTIGWIGILLGIIFGSATLYIVHFFRGRGDYFDSYLKCIWYLFGSHVMQGTKI